jgi:uncharacterized protein
MAFESFFEPFILLVFFFIFVAGIVDAIAGGGGLISIPILMIAFPFAAMPNIFGTNRFASFLGTSAAAYQYNRNHKANRQLLLYAGIPASIMAALGALCSHYMPTYYFKPIVILLLMVVILFSFLKKDFGSVAIQKNDKYQLLYASMIGLVIGFYNGFIGPGTGTFLLFSLVTVIGFNFIQASATAKILNVIVDLSSLTYFIYTGAVVFKLAIPMAICNIFGAYLGSKIAISKGSQFIRYVFLCVSLALVIKLGYDYLFI